MSRPTIRRQARALASLTAVAGLGLAAVTATTTPARSAAPGGDCATAFPVAELTNGDPVTGLTVTQGTTPSEFTGEVLGVLNDGIAPDLDMIMIELSSPEIDRVGIWQGMSGSPVYAADGRLIGAVSYSLAAGASTIAGVTPFEAMDEYLGDAAAKVSVDRATARSLARRTDAGFAQAAQGFAQLPMPIGVAGVGAKRLADAAERAGDRAWLPRSAYAVGRAAEEAAGVEDIVAGGNLAASMAYGDVTIAAIGTATSVCDDRVVGFGHPAAWAGSTTLGLHAADAIHIQDDLFAGFKVANLGDLVGTITEDRIAGITGALGEMPTSADVSITLTKGERTRTGVSHVPLRTPDALASTTLYGIIADHQAVVDGPVVGTEDLGWTITGTDPEGAPFELTWGNLYSSQWDLSWEVGFDVGDIVYGLSQIEGVTVDTITTESELTDATSIYRLGKLETKRNGEWVTVGRRGSLRAEAGETLVARATLTGTGDPIVVPISVKVPKSFAGRRAYLQLMGGSSIWPGGVPRKFENVSAWLDDRLRNDEIQLVLSRGPRSGHGGHGHAEQVSDGGMRGASGPRSVEAVVGPVGSVVRGFLDASVIVR